MTDALIFDTHAHYDDSAFDEDREALIASLPENGVCGVINCGTTLESSERALSYAERWPYVYAAVGIHPEEAKAVPADYLERLKKLAAHPKAVAIGEVGLDYHWEDNAPRDAQRRYFEEQLRLAGELSLPVIIHDREAHGDTLALLKKHRPKGVLHCFSGSVETAGEAIGLGMYLGIGGSVTFKNARHPVEVAKAVPLDRLLLETDAPYMAPVPNRGRRNDSSMIQHVAQRIAEIRGIDPQTVLRAARDNACRLFSIS